MKDDEYKQMILDINKILNEVCDEGRMKYHIIPVVETSKKMAYELGADAQVVEVAAYLHDITRVTIGKENHHITGAQYAEKFLKQYNIEQEKSKLIQDCILKHRGSTNIERETIEEKIVATADAIAHIEYPLSLFYTWYGKRKCSLSDGAKGIREKLQRSWDKIEFDYKKEELKGKYNYIMEVVSNYE